MFEFVDFGGFELGFHVCTLHYSAVFTVRHVGPCRICRLGSDIFLVVYICIYLDTCDCAANFVLQVAVGCFCVCSVACLFVSCFCFGLK